MVLSVIGSIPVQITYLTLTPCNQYTVNSSHGQIVTGQNQARVRVTLFGIFSNLEMSENLAKVSEKSGKGPKSRKSPGNLIVAAQQNLVTKL